MPVEQAGLSDPVVKASDEVLSRIEEGYGPRDYAVRFWDQGVREPDAGKQARFTIALTHPGSVRRMFWPPGGSTLGEAYIYGDFDIEGDMDAFMGYLQHIQNVKRRGLRKLRLGWKIFSLPKSDRERGGKGPAKLSGKKHSIERDKQAVGYAYDTSNDFYALWLDKELLYTCAYFKTADDTLEQAQLQKMDLVCRKLRLKPGDRFLDIGCGWGGLVTHAAKHYGVNAVGTTLSRKQVETATERIRQAGLQDRCRVEYQDYREIKDQGGFDKIASIGMQEHVGSEMLLTYFQCAFDLLKPGGVFLNHAINRMANHPPTQARFFTQKFVFPDGELRPISEVLTEAENAGFEVRDVESLREHYAMTLAHWRARLEKVRGEATAVADESTYRVFRLYLAGARNGFRTGLFNLHQSLLLKPDKGRSGLPLTRTEWYA